MEGRSQVEKAFKEGQERQEGFLEDSNKERRYGPLRRSTTHQNAENKLPQDGSVVYVTLLYRQVNCVSQAGMDGSRLLALSLKWPYTQSPASGKWARGFIPDGKGQPSTETSAAPMQASPTPVGRTAAPIGTSTTYTSWKNSLHRNK
ncbi:hypothetical protein STEG23_030898 [Scotinomys teguina]